MLPKSGVQRIRAKNAAFAPYHDPSNELATQTSMQKCHKTLRKAEVRGAVQRGDAMGGESHRVTRRVHPCFSAPNTTELSGPLVTGSARTTRTKQH